MQLNENKQKPVQIVKPAGKTAPLVRQNVRGSFEHSGDLESTRRMHKLPAKVDVLEHSLYEALRDIRAIQIRLQLRGSFGTRGLSA
jgi:hypothetical protein